MAILHDLPSVQVHLWSGRMKLDLGGIGKKGSWTTVNMVQPCDILWDLDDFPYPFGDSSVHSIKMRHTFEHLKEPFRVLEELYRICKPKAPIIITVPYWRDDTIGLWHKARFKIKDFLNLDHRAKPNLTKPGKFRVVDAYYIKGRFRFWKHYSLKVVLEVVK